MKKVMYKGVELEVEDDVAFSHAVLTESDENVKWTDIMLATDKDKLFIKDVELEDKDFNSFNFEKFAKSSNLINFDEKNQAVSYFMDHATQDQKLKLLDTMVGINDSYTAALEKLGYIQVLRNPDSSAERYFFLSDAEKESKSLADRFIDYLRTQKEPVEKYNDVFNEMSALNSVIKMDCQINNGGLEQYFYNDYDQENGQGNNQDVVHLDKDGQVETLKDLIKFGEENSLITAEDAEKITKTANFIDSVKKVEYADMDWYDKEEILKNAFDEHVDWFEDAVLSGDYRDMFQSDYYLGDDLKNKLEDEVFINNKYEIGGDAVEEEYEVYKEEWCDEHDCSVDDIDEDTGIDGYCYLSYEEWCDEKAESTPSNFDENGETFEEKFGDEFDSIDDIDDTTVYHYDDDVLEEEYTYTDVLDPDDFAENIIANNEEYNWDVNDYYLYIDDCLVTTNYQFEGFEKEFAEVTRKIEMLIEAKAQYLVKANNLDKIQYVEEKKGLDKLEVKKAEVSEQPKKMVAHEENNHFKKSGGRD